MTQHFFLSHIWVGSHLLRAIARLLNGGGGGCSPRKKYLFPKKGGSFECLYLKVHASNFDYEMECMFIVNLSLKGLNFAFLVYG